jgi:hypothetical protein
MTAVISLPIEVLEQGGPKKSLEMSSIFTFFFFFSKKNLPGDFFFKFIFTKPPGKFAKVIQRK